MNLLIEKERAVSAEQNRIMQIFKQGLLEDTLPFWLKHGVDKEFGGYLTSLDRDGKLIDSDKGIWVQGRFAWLLATLYNDVDPNSEWLTACEKGIDFLDRYGFDKSDGRMWFHVTQSGEPIRKRRYSFSEAFACIAYAEYSKAVGSEEYKKKAISLFEKYQTYLDGPDFTPKFTDTRKMVGIGRYMIDIVTCLILRKAADYTHADRIIDSCINKIRTLFVKEELKCVMENVGPGGEIYDHYDSRILNPGHAIECAWFIMKEGSLRNKEEYIDLGCKMLEWMWCRGWDKQFGGILYFTDVYNKPVQEYWHDMKFWWPHNETVIATLMAYSLTGQKKFADMFHEVHNWTYERFPDPEFGEWFGYLHRDGSVSSTVKGNMWKGPFHMPRMQLECWQILQNCSGLF